MRFLNEAWGTNSEKFVWESSGDGGVLMGGQLEMGGFEEFEFFRGN